MKNYKHDELFKKHLTQICGLSISTLGEKSFKSILRSFYDVGFRDGVENTVEHYNSNFDFKLKENKNEVS
jgi:hypothetical protein